MQIEGRVGSRNGTISPALSVGWENMHTREVNPRNNSHKHQNDRNRPPAGQTSSHPVLLRRYTMYEPENRAIRPRGISNPGAKSERGPSSKLSSFVSFSKTISFTRDSYPALSTEIFCRYPRAPCIRYVPSLPVCAWTTNGLLSSVRYDSELTETLARERPCGSVIFPHREMLSGGGSPILR